MTEALKPDSVMAVITSMAMGPSSLVRATAAILALLALLALRPGPRLWVMLVHLGVVASASFAWMGHGAATEGAAGLPHLAADIIHLLAAAVWIGALACFAGLAFDPRISSLAGQEALGRALHGFGGVGSALVAALLASGLVNSGFMIGPAGVAGLGGSLYGLLLIVKLALFMAMLGLAAANRFRHTPRLARAARQDRPAALAALKTSLALETGAAFLVLALVAWLGRLAPISSQ
jgi:putative copper resistance protein D